MDYTTMAIMIGLLFAGIILFILFRLEVMASLHKRAIYMIGRHNLKCVHNQNYGDYVNFDGIENEWKTVFCFWKTKPSQVISKEWYRKMQTIIWCVSISINDDNKDCDVFPVDIDLYNIYLKNNEGLKPIHINQVPFEITIFKNGVNNSTVLYYELTKKDAIKKLKSIDMDLYKMYKRKEK